MDYILEQHNIATIQLLALLAIYGQRSPYGAGSWSQIRYAMTLCIELGLHRKQASTTNTQEVEKEEAEMRRRVFWVCYCLDRLTTMTIGRTFAIADRDINVDLPTASPDFWHLTASTADEWHKFRPFLHVIHLRRLQSRIFKTVWRADRDLLRVASSERDKLDLKVEGLRRQLDEWLESIPVCPGDAQTADSEDYFRLQYHKTTLSLYTPLLPILRSSPSDERLQHTTRSAAAICLSYKALNATQTLSFTVVALHSCFIAGLTLVYCLWSHPGLFDYACLEATRACSVCLSVFGEKWPGAVKYRDAFDAMSGELLRRMFKGGDSHGAGLVFEAAGDDGSLLDAVQDAFAFTEVDESSAGADQDGWRVARALHR